MDQPNQSHRLQSIYTLLVPTSTALGVVLGHSPWTGLNWQIEKHTVRALHHWGVNEWIRTSLKKKILHQTKSELLHTGGLKHTPWNRLRLIIIRIIDHTNCSTKQTYHKHVRSLVLQVPKHLKYRLPSPGQTWSSSWLVLLICQNHYWGSESYLC